MLTGIVVSEKDKILVIAPHPDDECIGAGGILCTYPNQCSVIVLTDGRGGHTGGTDKECVSVRKKELALEMEFLNIKNYKCIGIHDGMLMKYQHCLDHIDLSSYTKIFVTGQYDGHEDHSAAFICVMNAVKFQQLIDVEIYLYEVHKELSNATHFLNISKCIDKKIASVRCHKSQIITVPYDRYVHVNAECRALQQRQKNQFWEVYQKISFNNDKEYGSDNEINIDLQKFKMFYKVLTEWLMKDESRIDKLLTDKYQVHSCVIYGYAELGHILRNKLQYTEIEIPYIMDKKIQEDPDGNLPFFYPSKDLEKPDAVIVTAIFYFDEIKKELNDIGFHSVYSLYDIVMEL